MEPKSDPFSMDDIADSDSAEEGEVRIGEAWNEALVRLQDVPGNFAAVEIADDNGITSDRPLGGGQHVNEEKGGEQSVCCFWGEVLRKDQLVTHLMQDHKKEIDAACQINSPEAGVQNKKIKQKSHK